MSEPIQSISQGNYILQGTVATSAGIVGDGSTQNPLRADETVLWSGSTNISANPIITANESVHNFEKVEFIGKGYPTDYDTTFGTCFFNTESTNTCWMLGYAGGAAGGAIRFNQFRLSASNNILSIDWAKQFSITGTSTTTANTPAVLTKIVGINRK